MLAMNSPFGRAIKPSTLVPMKTDMVIVDSAHVAAKVRSDLVSALAYGGKTAKAILDVGH